MKTRPPFQPKRPFGRGGAIPRHGVEAAAQLLKTEFERQRHRRERDHAARRLTEADRALSEQDARARALCARILDGGEDT